MKRLRYIFACFISFLIIYMGAGVAVMQYCCAQCELMDHSTTAQETGCAACRVHQQTASCCASSVSDECDVKHSPESASCIGKGCSAKIYELDFMEHSVSTAVFAPPVIQLFLQEFPDILCALQGNDKSSDAFHIDLSPHPASSRHYLSLFSTLLI
ncbi:hypothetical protein [Bacteroides ihuae]|uniref:hypothetical protein n=1 Tax=Bacteroides ihuae TaxID=1852362 RepID=UPI0008D9F95C|nr:hypothetical protein [Bacteroides ihuae]